MPERLSPDIFRDVIGKRGATERLPMEGEEEEGGEKILDEGEWRSKVSEIVTKARGEIEAITPPEFVDRIDDEIRTAIEGREAPGGEATGEGL